MYKLIKSPTTGEINAVTIVGQNICIPFAPDNTDYANFKKQILADEAQLQDAEGVTMSAAAAKEYISTLP